jgi:hypothetical protein
MGGVVSDGTGRVSAKLPRLGSSPVWYDAADVFYVARDLIRPPPNVRTILEVLRVSEPMRRARLDHRSHGSSHLHDLVCAGTMTLAAVRHEIPTNWKTLYQHVYGTTP